MKKNYSGHNGNWSSLPLNQMTTVLTRKKGIPQILHLWKKTLPAAAYEFSVRKQSDPKRSVTYCKLSSGFTSARSWEARLLCHSDVRAQVNRVVGLGYSMFVE